MKVGIFVDVENLYYNTKRKHNNRINYTKLLAFCEDFGDLVIRIAYSNKTDKNEQFLSALEGAGYEIKDNNIVEMTKDLLSANCDLTIICSNNAMFLTLKDKFKKTLMLGVNVSILKDADVMEIPQSLLMR